MTDRFGREITYLRLSVTDRCNLRCRYCMPADGISIKSHDDMLTEEEILTAAETAAGLGISKIRITGGEPLVKKNILSICRGICAVPGILETAITTNGILLPEYVRELKAAGIGSVNISLDTLNPEKYRQLTRGGNLSEAFAGLEAALSAGFRKVKINAVLIGGINDAEIRDLAKLTLDRDLDVRFIELMPMTKGAFCPGAFISADRVLRELPELLPEGSQGTAQLFRLPCARGRIGLIRPLSSSFCSVCNRLRLTADGYIKPCLQSSLEYRIKGLDREGMQQMFLTAVQNKPECHGPLSAEFSGCSGRSMNTIGG